MRIGIFAALANPFATPDYLHALGPAAEERGFHSIWVAEHLVLFDAFVARLTDARGIDVKAAGLRVSCRRRLRW